MIQFIKEHWIQYLIGATIAVLLGLGLSFYLGEKFSTPASVRAARAAQAQEEQKGEDADEELKTDEDAKAESAE